MNEATRTGRVAVMDFPEPYRLAGQFFCHLLGNLFGFAASNAQ
jgi:hypothetical protein